MSRLRDAREAGWARRHDECTWLRSGSSCYVRIDPSDRCGLVEEAQKVQGCWHNM